jgi:hypothetical protein
LVSDDIIENKLSGELMPETCNRRQKCTNEKYKDSQKCILHCTKEDFTQNDVIAFWQKIRSEYPFQNGYYAQNDLYIEGVIFPSFNDRWTFFPGSKLFDNVVTFKNCTFTEDIQLSDASSRGTLIFEQCTLHGDINWYAANKVQIINCTFKNDTHIGNQKWQNIEVLATKFIKEAYISASTQVKLTDNCIFRDNLYVDGFHSMQFYLDGVECNKQLTSKRISSTDIDSIRIKSEATFEQNTSINMTSSFFAKDTVFTACSLIEASNTEFSKKTLFPSTHYNSISLQDTKLTDLHLQSGDDLSINTTHLKSLKIEGSFERMIIEESSVSEKLAVYHVVESVQLINNQFSDTVNFHGEYSELEIQNCNFIDLHVSTVKQLIIDNGVISGTLLLHGENYEGITVSNIEIENIIEIGKAEKVLLEGVKKYPSIKLNAEFYKEIFIVNSKILDLAVNSNEVMKISSTTIKGVLALVGEKNENITFDDVTFKKVCDFPNINFLSICNSRFWNPVTFCQNNVLKCEDVEFKGGVGFLEDRKELSLESCKFEDSVDFSPIKETLFLEKCQFNGFTTFSAGLIHKLFISLSHFRGETLFLGSSIIELYINGFDEQTIFEDTVMFQQCIIEKIEISNSHFQALKFMKMKNTLELSYFKNTYINCLEIDDCYLIDLFKNTERVQLEIEDCSIINSKLDTHDNSNEMDISGIAIRSFKWNKVITLKVLNFTNMLIGKWTIGNCNIENRVRLKYSSIEDINLIACTFEDLQIIDNLGDQKELTRNIRLKNTTIKNAVLDKLIYWFHHE